MTEKRNALDTFADIMLLEIICRHVTQQGNLHGLKISVAPTNFHQSEKGKRRLHMFLLWFP